MTVATQYYTTQLDRGLGLLEETKILLSFFQDGMTIKDLFQFSLNSGRFPNISAKRLNHIISGCFFPRYVKTKTASYLKVLSSILQTNLMNQLFFVFTALANKIFFDFVTEVFWIKYASNHDTIYSINAREFVINAIREGRTATPWSDATIKRNSSYLIGCCADYGLVTLQRSSEYKINPIHIQEPTTLFLVYWLHFQSLSDNGIIHHSLWKLFGMEPEEVKEELKGLSKNGWLILQSGGDVTRIHWSFNSMEEVVDVLIK